jgi:hypothetical protein
MMLMMAAMCRMTQISVIRRFGFPVYTIATGGFHRVTNLCGIGLSKTIDKWFR